MGSPTASCQWPWRTAAQHRLPATRQGSIRVGKSDDNGGSPSAPFQTEPPKRQPRPTRVLRSRSHALLAGDSHPIPINSRVASSSTTTGVKEMLPAACQLSVTSIVGGNGTLIPRSHSRVDALDEIEAKSGATTTARLRSPTGNTDDVIELGHPPEGPQPEASGSISR
jgi:hypothetical protein